MQQDRKPARRKSSEPEDTAPVIDPPEAQLQFIRDVMSRTSTFTAVPGWGAVAMGGTALIASFVASRMISDQLWLVVWLVEAILAAGIGLVTLIWKAKRSGAPLGSGAGRKFITGLLPPLFAGAILTLALWHNEGIELLPGTWMLLYGIGTLSGGAYSVRIIPLIGLLFIAMGSVALFLPLSLSNGMMALAFGGIHLGFGISIAKNYGG